MPKYLKVDIESAYRYCILALTSNHPPSYLSFEIGSDGDKLLTHVSALGYKRFKLINQVSFREVNNMDCIYDRIARKAIQYMGYAQPRMIERAGRFFISGHSSGPVPWNSDGQWQTADQIRAILQRKSLPDWYDIHAAIA